VPSFLRSRTLHNPLSSLLHCCARAALHPWFPLYQRTHPARPYAIASLIVPLPGPLARE
jgi:hypothetical protein